MQQLLDDILRAKGDGIRYAMDDFKISGLKLNR